MAWDLLRKKQTEHDWSCSIGDSLSSSQSTVASRISKHLDFNKGVIGGAMGGIFLGYQLGAGMIEKRYGITQSQHLRAKRRR
jgi:hypothetical protein